MTKKAGVLILGCLLVARIAAAASSPEPDLASADWSVAAKHSPAKRPPSSQAVWKFMTHYWGDAWIEQGKLCSFRFVDLRDSGELSLLAIYDGGGTLDCDDLSIFDKVSGGVEEFDYAGYAGAPVRDDNVNNVVRDLAGDGHWELVVRPYNAVTGEDLWPSIYAWSANGYTNVSSRYPKYYRTWLASLKKEIAKLKKERQRLLHATAAPPPSNLFVNTHGLWQSGSAPAPPASVHPMQPEQPGAAPPVAPEVEAASRHEIDDKEAQAAKIERFLGSKDAGMLDAIRWANSRDPYERTLAAHVFADMGTPEALKYEQTLSRGADPKVAKGAQHALYHWSQHGPYRESKHDPYSVGTFDLVRPTDSGLIPAHRGVN